MLCKIVSPQKDIYKLSCFPATFQELLSTIKSRCGQGGCQSICLKYIDSENELIALNNNEDFLTAVRTCEVEQLKTLKVFVLPEGTIGASTLQQSESPDKSSNSVPLQAGSSEESKEASPKSKKDKNTAGACVQCHQEIQNVKYACLQCEDYQCCQPCEAKTEHQHPLLKIRLSVPVKLNELGNTPKKSEKKSHGVLLRNTLQRSTGKTLYSSKLSFDKRQEQITSVEPSQELYVRMVVKNNGKEAWPEGTRLRCVNGNYIHKEIKVSALESGCKQSVLLSLEAPAQCGKYLSQWMLSYNDDGKQRSFGQNLFLEFFVERNGEDDSEEKNLGDATEVKRLFHQDSERIDYEGKWQNEKRFVFRTTSYFGGVFVGPSKRN